jgi:hypothetical protein
MAGTKKWFGLAALAAAMAAFAKKLFGRAAPEAEEPEPEETS